MARYSKNEDVEKIVNQLRSNITREQAESCYKNALKIPDNQRVPLAVNGDMVWISQTKAVKVFKELAAIEEE